MQIRRSFSLGQLLDMEICENISRKYADKTKKVLLRIGKHWIGKHEFDI